MAGKPNRAGGDPQDNYLLSLGERVRLLRARRGMSRKALAQQSDVSERHLAQLEGGTGNWSIVLLRRVALALSVPVAELVDDRPERPIEGQLVAEFLARLSSSELARVHALLRKHFGGAFAIGREGRIALIGLRGGGKSTIGKILGVQLEWPFIELDRAIEEHAGMPLAEIFEMFGQAGFRRMEREALERVIAENTQFVLATGGGLVTQPGTYETLLSTCIVAWLQATPEEHMSRVAAQGDLRPMAGNANAMDELVSILSSRRALYSEADLALDTTGQSPEESARRLLKALASKMHFITQSAL